MIIAKSLVIEVQTDLGDNWGSWCKDERDKVISRTRKMN